MRNPVKPRATHAASRRWTLWVNTVAASPYLSYDARKRLYRSMGITISPESYEIGAHCYIHSAELTVGARTRINDRCWFENTAQVRIGEGVAIGAHVVIITSTHDLGPRSARASGGWRYLPVTVEDGCWIGARSTILGGVTIGAGSIIAAGAVVASDTDPDCLYGGVPARKIKALDVAVRDPAAAVPTGASIVAEIPPTR
jgi:maltose O-acetyltransferase